MIISSAVLAGDRGIPEEVLAESGAGPSGPAAGGFEFGVDPSLDPELAMVRRISLLKIPSIPNSHCLALRILFPTPHSIP